MPFVTAMLEIEIALQLAFRWGVVKMKCQAMGLKKGMIKVVGDEELVIKGYRGNEEVRRGL